jgi:hypothetical protein
MLRDLGDRENTRVRDLVDLVILIEAGWLDAPLLAIAAREVWAERDGGAPPTQLGRLPSAWRASYPTLVADLPVNAGDFSVAAALVARLWTDMFPAEEA